MASFTQRLIASIGWPRAGAADDHCGKDFQRGILLYIDQDRLPSGDKCMLAVPLNEL